MDDDWRTKEQTEQGKRGVPNRLIHEKSPYLLQHAYNPVDWLPWGEEAFSRARREKKPVFLSIGYSTCHWCHVMARESFEDPTVAEFLNRYFVSVKVDREERPDVDAVYMAACQAVTGSGGWPLTLVLDEEQRPFFVGTYLPKISRYGQMGLLEMLDAVHRQWEKEPGSLKEVGDRVTRYLKSLAKGEYRRADSQEENIQKSGQWQSPYIPGTGENRENNGLSTDAVERLLGQAARWFTRQFDKKYGGFGNAPKFPQAHQLLFLMDYGEKAGEPHLMEMAEHTLKAMYRGGIFDQIGGGFSRYSTDERWLAPHFEKMLYDNGLLAEAYLEAFSRTGKVEYGEAARRIFTYVNRELLQKEGGFSCGQDADSEGEEGKYYLFDRTEILDVLGEDRGREFCQIYHITKQGNFEGKNIPNRIGDGEEVRPFWWQEAVDLLLCYRRERGKLHLDDKVLTSWNCLMIGAFARAAVILGEEAYGHRARASMEFLRRNLKDEKGSLQVCWRDGEAAFPGQLEDYAFYALASLKLYEAFGEETDFKEAVWAAWEIPRLFGDPENGGFFRYSVENEVLIIRPKEFYDGAVPSGNGAAALVFSRIYHMTGMPEFGELRDKQLLACERASRDFPAGYTMGLLAFLEAEQEPAMCTLKENALEPEGALEAKSGARKEEPLRAGAFAPKPWGDTCKMQGKQYKWAREKLEEMEAAGRCGKQ